MFTGADRIAANGDVANKVGTYGLAVAASHHGLPFHVVAPTSTLDPSAATGADIPIEQRDPAEITRALPGAQSRVRRDACRPRLDDRDRGRRASRAVRGVPPDDGARVIAVDSETQATLDRFGFDEKLFDTLRARSRRVSSPSSRTSFGDDRASDR